MAQHPCLPLHPDMLRTIETAGLMALHSLAAAAGKPAEAWHPELRDMARAALAPAEQGIGIEAADLAERALQALNGDGPAAHLPLLAELHATLLAQMRVCNWRQFSQAQERVRRWVATTPSPAR